MSKDNATEDHQVWKIDDWADFDLIIGQMQNRQWIFRGQSDVDWELKSSLYRTFEFTETITELSRGKPKKIARNRHEELAIQRFINSAHLYLDYRPPEDQTLEWLAIMQHYGAPTRLIDFTFSPYVAAYFALESGVKDAVIYCIATKKSSSLIDDIKNFKLNENKSTLYIFEPEHPSQRLLAQQGVFLVPGTLKKSHDEILDLMKDNKDEFIIKLRIPKKIREEGLNRLRKYNINSSILFPGLEGFCKTFNYQGLFKLADEERIGTPIERYPADDIYS